MNTVSAKSEKGFRFPGVEVTGSCELLVWELNSLLIIGPSLQLYNPLFKNLFPNKTIF